MKKLLFISLIFLLSCDPTGWTSYKVKRGKHRSTNKVTILKKDVVSFQFTTDSTWYWETPEKNGWSKVSGIAWTNNHYNSARLVYMRLNDSTGVFGYYFYSNGVSPQDNPKLKGIMDTITIGKSYLASAGWENGYYFVRLGDKHNSIGVPKPFGVRNLAHPFIGGTYVIEHDWKTSIKIY
ncbi:MAG: hypothetical protein QM487_14285 [Candidatus Marithrix sp.]